MKIHQATDSADIRPVLFRHAKCKNCDERFRYHVSAAENDRGTRPPCPACDEQGIGGPFGRINPAEWLPVIAAAGDGTRFENRDWLAGRAALVNRTDEDHDDLFVYVGERKAYLPCRTTTHIDADGTMRTGFPPRVWGRWFDNGADIQLVDVDELPEHRWDNRLGGEGGEDDD